MTRNEDRRDNQGVLECQAMTSPPIPIGCVDLVSDKLEVCGAPPSGPAPDNQSEAGAWETTPVSCSEFVLGAASEDDVDCRAVLRLGGNGF